MNQTITSGAWKHEKTMPENSAFSYVPFCLLSHMCLSKDVSNKEKTDAFQHRRKSHQKMHFFGTQLLCAPCGTAWYWLMIAAEFAKVPEGSVPIRRCIKE